MLTAEQLNAIKERAEKATAGPWEKSVLTNGYILSGEKLNVVASTVEFKDDGSIHNTFTKNYENNRSFIAHSRTDIPALLQTVEALSAILAETEETRDKIAKDWSNLLDERVTLKAKIATYESLAQEFDYGAILDEMDYEGCGSDD